MTEQMDKNEVSLVKNTYIPKTEEEEEEFSMEMDDLDDNDNESPFLMSSDEEKEDKKVTNKSERQNLTI